MDFSFEISVLKVASEKRQLLHQAESLFKKESQSLNVELAFDLDLYATQAGRSEAVASLRNYTDQLTVEKQFYTNFHLVYLEEIISISNELNESDMNRFLERSLPGLKENQQIRLGINHEKSQAVIKTLELIEFINEHQQEIDISEEIEVSDSQIQEKFEKLLEEIDQSLDKQYILAAKQRERGREGQTVMQTFLNILKNN